MMHRFSPKRSPVEWAARLHYLAFSAGLLAATSVASATDVFSLPAGQTSLVMVPVGNVGNAPDTRVTTTYGTVGYGAVGYGYNIGQCDVTAGQYTTFLNAVATKSDTFGLYNPNMATGNMAACGIIQTPIIGGYPATIIGYSYSVDAQHQNYPVNFVSWGSAARFCNWLSNNQPSGQEGAGTTETGSYTLNGATDRASLMTITRNAGASYVIPTEDEWYKAAYYDPNLNGGAGGYWSYPTKSNSVPSNQMSSTGANNANFGIRINGDSNNVSWTDPTNYLTPVGTFAASPSAYDTFDQGGNVQQWIETGCYDYRGTRGGSWEQIGDAMLYTYDDHFYPDWQEYEIGFRVAEVGVPEPSSICLLGFGVIGILARRRAR